MTEPSGPGCCASFLLAIPGYLLLKALGVHDEPAFWISFLVILIGGGVTVPYLYWKRRGAQDRAGLVAAAASTSVPPPTSAGWRADPTGRHENRFWDGTGWTDNISDAGTAGRDPL